MGTRSLTHIVSQNKETVCIIYRQFDGYPEGMGKDLADFASNIKIHDGFPVEAKLGTDANGAGCFAAQLVSFLKQEVGNVYLVPNDTRCMGEEYIYTLYVVPYKEVYMKISLPDENNTIFSNYAKGLYGTSLEQIN